MLDWLKRLLWGNGSCGIAFKSLLKGLFKINKFDKGDKK